MRHLTAAWARVAAVKHDSRAPIEYPWPAQRLAIIEGSGYHPEADIDKARTKQEAGYVRWRANNPRRPRPDRYKPEHAEAWVGDGYGYFTSANSAPGTVAFVDFDVFGKAVTIHYMAVRPDKRGQRYARKMIQALYDRYPDSRINWGKMMQPQVGSLYASFQESHPDQTGSGSRYY